MARDINIPVGFDDERVADEVWWAYVAHGDMALQMRVLQSAFPQHLDRAIKTAKLQLIITDIARELAAGPISVDEAMELVKRHGT